GDRKLPGGLGHHDPRIAAAGTVWTRHRRRRAACLLGGRAWQKSDALCGWSAGRKLADGADERSRSRQVRRRLARAEFREPESFEYAVDQTVQRLFKGRYRGRAIPRIRTLVGRARQ